ncbi:MAG: T9SS type A sorting domain-containing protein [Flavipsychrobacter sp.]|nr:T9SS type A sorting domain-containing protein [Flavipsychrobacter sp.]
MRNFTLLFIITFFAATGSADAQQFVNGSFEPSGAITKCAYDTLAEFNAKMGGMWVKGADTGMIVVDNSCGMGAPAHGSYYVGTSYKSMTGSNYIMLRLTTPMQPDITYKFSFKYKGPASGTALTSLLGYSNDSTSTANFVHGIPAPSGSTWQVVNDSIKPNAISKYIWIAGSSTGGDGQVYYDNFVMQTSGGGTSVEQTFADATIAVYPNPVTDVAHIRLGEGVQYPVSITICDVTGKTIAQRNNITDKDIAIERARLNTGINILKITDKNNHTRFTRLIAR